jgi:hypothetical protein
MALGHVAAGAVRQYHAGAFGAWLVALASENLGEAPQCIQIQVVFRRRVLKPAPVDLMLRTF